jgi:hypothetical protein
MPRRPHRVSRCAPLAASLGLLAALALGWGLPHADAAPSPADPLVAHAMRSADRTTEAIVAVSAPVVEAVAARPDPGTFLERLRDTLAVAAGAVALLLLLASRRRLTIAGPQPLRVAAVAHGGRAPPV